MSHNLYPTFAVVKMNMAQLPATTRILIGLALLVLATACASDKAEAGQLKLLFPAPGPPPPAAEVMLRQIDSLQALVFPDGLTAGTDSVRAYPFVLAVERFAEAYPQHERAPQLLMDAAGVANGINWSNKSIQLWGSVWRSQPQHLRAPEAMFYQGFVLDTRYGDLTKAVEYYDRLIANYPEHELAKQAAQLRQIALGEQPMPPVPAPAGN